MQLKSFHKQGRLMGVVNRWGSGLQNKMEGYHISLDDSNGHVWVGIHKVHVLKRWWVCEYVGQNNTQSPQPSLTQYKIDHFSLMVQQVRLGENLHCYFL